MNTIQELESKGLISPPKWLPYNVMYETIMGSMAYGVSSDNSDFDIYGFCMPPKDVVFPHLAGEIHGFGKQIKRFEQYQQHHIKDPSANAGKGREYDIVIYSIVKYFQLCMENNPNMIDSLFTPANCVLTRTPIYDMILANRNLFLHKGCWHKFKGYSYSQLHKMRPKFEEDENGNWVQVLPTGKRRESVEKYGYDIKFAYHVIRLLCEVEQILTEGTLDLQRNREQLKSIRRGEWRLEEIEEWFSVKEKVLESVYAGSTLPHGPDEGAIKQLLIDCLEHHYGDLSRAIVVPGQERAALEEILRIAERGLR